ncbi:MAG TPA: hypothetical protein VGB63_07965 [Pedobacter sp.]|jgi:hypothetical protein
MAIITLKHEGKVYQRRVERSSEGIYIMHSKGLQYWFRKDAHINTNNGWHLVNGTILPDFMMELISQELDKFNNLVSF